MPLAACWPSRFRGGDGIVGIDCPGRDIGNDRDIRSGGGESTGTQFNLFQQIAFDVVLHHRVITTGILHHLRLIEEVEGAEGDGGQAWRGDAGDVAQCVVGVTRDVTERIFLG